MSQSRLMSFVEQCFNVGSGFFLAMLTWQFVVSPIWGFEVPLYENAAICAIFTVVSVLRGYVWRRIFNWIHHRPKGEPEMWENV